MMAKINKNSEFTVLTNLATISQLKKVLEIFEANEIRWASGQKASEYMPPEGHSISYNKYRNRHLMHAEGANTPVKITADSFIKKYGSGETFEYKGNIYRRLDNSTPWVADSKCESLKNAILSNNGHHWSPGNVIAIIPCLESAFVCNYGRRWAYAAEFVKVKTASRKVEMTIAELETLTGIKGLKIKKG